MSDDRRLRFEELARQVGPLIHEGLVRGMFGTTATDRLTDAPFPPPPTGKSRIQSFNGDVLENNRTVVNVWRNLDGSIDPDKSFDRISITDNNEDPNMEVLIVKPDKNDPFWTVFVTTGVTTIGNSFVENPYNKMLGYDRGDNLASSSIYSTPVGAYDYKRLDDTAIAMLQNFMLDWELDKITEG